VLQHDSALFCTRPGGVIALSVCPAAFPTGSTVFSCPVASCY